MSAILIEKVLGDEALAAIRRTISGGPYVPGSRTAVGGAARIKHNLQLAPQSPAAAKAVEQLVQVLNQNQAFQAAAWVDAMMTPLFCRYELGMTYGDHIDGAIMGEPPALVRCDIAVTICLNDSGDYDGGELVIDAAGLAPRWKGQAGDCLLYPADTLHRVEPVTRGTREVAIIWIQSLVRDPARRRLLFDLQGALTQLDQAGAVGPPVETLRRSYYNLIRMWT